MKCKASAQKKKEVELKKEWLFLSLFFYFSNVWWSLEHMCTQKRKEGSRHERRGDTEEARSLGHRL